MNFTAANYPNSTAVADEISGGVTNVYSANTSKKKLTINFSISVQVSNSPSTTSKPSGMWVPPGAQEASKLLAFWPVYRGCTGGDITCTGVLTQAF